MKKQTIFLLLFLFAFAACKKENYKKPNRAITGKVLEDKASVPIENADVTLARTGCRGVFNPFGCSNRKTIKIKTVETDVDGNFNINFYDDNISYYLIVGKNGYNTSTIPTLELDTAHFIIVMLTK